MTATDTPANSTLPRPLDYFVKKRLKLRRSLGFITLAWIFGSVWQFTTGGVQFTRFAEILHCSNFQFGLLSALPFLSSLICMPASLYIERTGERKIFFLVVLYAQRLLWIPIAVVPIWIVTHRGFAAAHQAALVFIVLCGLMYTAGSAGLPAWLGWMADVVPERMRGSYFSRRRVWGFILALPACWFTGWLLDTHTTPDDPMRTLRWCALIFLAAAVFGCADIAMHHFVPAVARKGQRGDGLYRALLQPLRNRQFLIFCSFIALMIFTATFVGQFLTLYLMKIIGVNNTGIQIMILVAPMAAQVFALPLWGKAADRHGKKPLMIISSLAIIPLGLAWSFVKPGTFWFPCTIAVLGSVVWNALEVANLNLVLEFSGPGDDGSSVGGASYSGVHTVITNLAGFVGGVAGGIIAQRLGDWTWTPAFWGLKAFTFYDVLFVGSSALRLLAVVIFLPLLHEPEARPTAEAVRFMTLSIYNGLFNTVRWPARFFLGAIRDRRR